MTTTANQRYNHRLKHEIFSHYSQGPPACACCGETHLEFLALDHEGGWGTVHRTAIGSTSGKAMYLWVKRNDFPGGFRVLCHNCNQSIGSYGYCPHEEPSKIQPEKTVAQKNEALVLEAAQDLVAEGTYPSLAKLNKRLGKNAPGLVLAHRGRLQEKGEWPCEVASRGKRGRVTTEEKKRARKACRTRE